MEGRPRHQKGGGLSSQSGHITRSRGGSIPRQGAWERQLIDVSHVAVSLFLSLKSIKTALAGVGQWLEHGLLHRRAAGLMPKPPGLVREATNQCVSLSPSPPSPPTILFSQSQCKIHPLVRVKINNNKVKSINTYPRVKIKNILATEDSKLGSWKTEKT